LENSQRIAHLFDQSETIKLSEHTLLNSSHGKAENIYLIKKGAIKVFKKKQGELFILSIGFEGDVIGLEQLFNDSVNDKYYYAIPGTEIKQLSIAPLQNTLKTNSQINMEVLQYISEMTDQVEVNLMNVTQRSVTCNMANLLLKLNSIKCNGIIPCVVTTKDLANLIGTTINYVYKTLQNLESKKIVSFKDRRVRIVNNELLKQLAANGKN